MTLLIYKDINLEVLLILICFSKILIMYIYGEVVNGLFIYLFASRGGFFIL